LFLLFSFYFFVKDRWWLYLLFLILSLSFKEHMSLLAVMYGLYALYLKRSWRWVLVPIVMGVAWGVFSIWLTGYFQTIYHVDPLPTWMFNDLKDRFFPPGAALGPGFWFGFKTSNFSNIQSLELLYSLFAPLLLAPFFSPVWLLGIPELLINNLSSRLMMYPTWHYCVLTSCFLLAACVEGVKKVSASGWMRKFGLPVHKIQELLAWLICLCVAGHCFLWAGFLPIKQDRRYVQTRNEAVRIIPVGASVSVVKNLAAFVSCRRDYFLPEDSRKGEYILLDQEWKFEKFFSDPRQALNYVRIFGQDGVEVYKAVKR
jgi:uncharacterized membrane protein